MGAEKRRHGRLCPDLAAVEVHQPNVVRHFKVGLVEEEAGRHSDDVRGGSEEELRVEVEGGEGWGATGVCSPPGWLFISNSKVAPNRSGSLPVQPRPCRWAAGE